MSKQERIIAAARKRAIFCTEKAKNAPAGSEKTAWQARRQESYIAYAVAQTA